MSSSSEPRKPMIARSAEAVTSSLPPRSLRPQEVLDRLRVLIEDGQIGAARRLTEEAAGRFPNYRAIRLARRILAPGTATSNPFVQATAAAESEWLDNPPDEARGKWVALIGSELVAMADSVEDLMESLKSRNPQKLPLVHRLAE